MSLQGHREHHAKTGSAALSQSQIEKIRKDRVKNLTLSAVDLSKDPFFLKNHLGTYECKLCLTLHNNEGNYLAHTQGKRHQAKLAKRLEQEKERELRKKRRDQGLEALKSTVKVHKKTVRIGRPGYNMQKRRGENGENVLIFQIEYPEIASNTRPLYRFLSAFEQKVDMPPDSQYQYLAIAAEPYETIAFKVPNIPIDMDRIVKRWHADQKIFALKVYFDNPQRQDGDEEMGV
eukprot:CAMPEP_0117445858 /NCGR_PEP_ID=MMETSP0759-20121206/6023_1 /TAXON_ID=63605 /ORGANISM="Percolomonas cosmopolitus, Strain WS" /LENGTH=232 /DNA_ID=CAMNT_0005238069 /DNA_START=148 /DNA_END=846 /DNA_ORIENTATION=+